MTLTFWLARRLWRVACAAMAAFLIAGTVAGFGVGALCRNAGPATGAPFDAAAVCGHFSGFGIICAATGVAMIGFFALSAGWPRPAPADVRAPSG